MWSPCRCSGSPQQWNPYSYSNNNPVTYSDPSGLFCDGCYTQNGAIIGVGCPPCHSDPKKAQEDYEVASGRNKDPWKQPYIADHRVPTFDELKQRPGFHHYMNGGSYKDAVRDWAQNICMVPGEGNDEFCSLAGSYGMLEPDNPALHKAMFFLTVGLVLLPVAAECAASVMCPRIVAGVADAISPEGAAFAGGTGIVGGGKLLDAAADAGRAACSFTGDTVVLMADGSQKPIEDVDRGDEVLAVDPRTGERVVRAVTALIVHKDTVVDLVTEDGSRITTTEDHPFWNATDAQWQRADQLDSGDELLSAGGHPVRVAGLDRATARTATAHNLTVDRTHTYYVGHTPVAVHNSCPDGALARFIATAGGDIIDRQSVAKTVSYQTQGRHVRGDRNYGGESYFVDRGDAQAVLDEFHNGSATVLGVTSRAHIIVRSRAVTGYNHNPGAGYPNQPTDVFYIKGTKSPSVVPYHPQWTP